MMLKHFSTKIERIEKFRRHSWTSNLSIVRSHLFRQDEGDSQKDVSCDSCSKVPSIGNGGSRERKWGWDRVLRE